MFWGINLPPACCGVALCNTSVTKCALNSSCELHSAVNESAGSFCYKWLFPKVLLQRGNETLLDLECWESFLPVVDFEPAQMFTRIHKTKRSWGWPICCYSVFLPLKFLRFLNSAAWATAHSPRYCRVMAAWPRCWRRWVELLHKVSWYC